MATRVEQDYRVCSKTLIRSGSRKPPVNPAAFIGSYMLMSDTRRSQSQPRFEYLGCAAGFQETRDVRKRVLRRPHYGRLAVRVLR